MKELIVEKKEDVRTGDYRAWYRCANCGVVFQADLKKGEAVAQMKDICPVCGVRSGTAGVGVFPIVKYNPAYDQFQRHYYK